MKRLLALILFGMLLISANAFAEEFTLRNGIAFGDTMDDVLTKETFAIDGIRDECDDEDISSMPYPYWIRTEYSTLAGIPDSNIMYRFNADKQLREVIYNFRGKSGSTETKDVADTEYNTVNSGLIKKYGEPLGFSDGTCYIITGGAFEDALRFLNLMFYGELYDYDEWDVKCDDYHVKVEQLEYGAGISKNNASYFHKIGYTYFTDDELEAAIQEKRDTQAALEQEERDAQAALDAALDNDL